MNKRFVRQALEEYAARHMPPRPDLWPAIRRQVQPVPATSRRFAVNNLGRVVLPTAILLGLVAVALVLGPVFSRAGLLSGPGAGAGNPAGPALTPTSPPATASPLTSQIYVMNADGTNPVQWTSGVENRHYQPAWSPDGRKLAFGVSEGDGYAIYVMNADGSDLRRVVPSSPSAWGPVWSPDGTTLAFSAGSGQKREIYTIAADGTNPRQLTANAADVTGLAWSPDGTRIAFASTHEGTSQIYVMQSDGTNPMRLTKTGANDRNPAWAPDGSRIAFDSDRDGTSQIYVMHPDGTAQTRLTTSPGPDLAPAWSPDGQWIMFTSRRDGDSDLYQMHADGSALTNLTHSPAMDEAWGAWSPDGQRIAFAAQAARPMPPPTANTAQVPPTPDPEALLDDAFSRDPTFSRIDAAAMQPVDLSQTINGYTVNVRRVYANANRVIIGVIVTSPPGTDVELLGGGLTTTTGIRLPFSLGVYTAPAPVIAYAYAYDNRVNDTMPTVITSQLTLNLVDMAPVRAVIAQITPVNLNTTPMPPGSERTISPPQAAGPFTFDLQVPVIPTESRIVPVNQTVTAAGMDMTLEKLVIAGGEARAFLHFRVLDNLHWWRHPVVTLAVAGWSAEVNSHLNPLSDWLPLSDAAGTYTFRDFPAGEQGDAVLTVTELVEENSSLTPTTGTILPGPWTFQFTLPPKSPQP
jgi:hypothetical protein